jgi:hypothetical protein
LDKEEKMVNPTSKAPKEEQTSFKKLMVSLLDINFIVLINYIITFAVFPGVSIMPSLL